MKDTLETTGQIIFELSKLLAQDKLSGKKAAELSFLYGSDTDESGSELVERVIGVVSNNFPTEIIQREGNILQDI